MKKLASRRIWAIIELPHHNQVNDY
jgi:hypothetical protein